MTVDAPTARPGLRWRPLRVALAGFLLPIALVVAGPARPASAVPPAVLAIGAGGVEAAPAAVACAASVVCLGVTGVVMLGITAYATKDLWMPAVKDFFNV